MLLCCGRGNGSGGRLFSPLAFASPVRPGEVRGGGKTRRLAKGKGRAAAAATLVGRRFRREAEASGGGAVRGRRRPGACPFGLPWQGWEGPVPLWLYAASPASSPLLAGRPGPGLVTGRRRPPLTAAGPTRASGPTHSGRVTRPARVGRTYPTRSRRGGLSLSPATIHFEGSCPLAASPREGSTSSSTSSRASTSAGANPAGYSADAVVIDSLLRACGIRIARRAFGLRRPWALFWLVARAALPIRALAAQDPAKCGAREGGTAVVRPVGARLIREVRRGGGSRRPGRSPHNPRRCLEP